MGIPAFQCEFNKAHRHQRVLFAGLENKSIAGGDRHREHPQRNHRREIEWRDACTDTEWLQDRVGIDAARNVGGQLTHLQRADVGGVLDPDFQSTENIAFRIRQGSSPCSAVRIAASSFMFSRMSCWYCQEDTPARTPMGVLRQVLNVALRCINRSVQFLRRGERHPRQHLLRRGIDHVAPLRAAGLRMTLAIDEQLYGGDGL